MPELSRFGGMVIYMLFMDTKQHNKPHVHVYYGDYHYWPVHHFAISEDLFQIFPSWQTVYSHRNPDSGRSGSRLLSSFAQAEAAERVGSWYGIPSGQIALSPAR